MWFPPDDLNCSLPDASHDRKKWISALRERSCTCIRAMAFGSVASSCTSAARSELPLAYADAWQLQDLTSQVSEARIWFHVGTVKYINVPEGKVAAKSMFYHAAILSFAVVVVEACLAGDMSPTAEIDFQPKSAKSAA